MPSFAEIAKYMIPALAGVAGAIQPKTADALSDIVSMRQAMKDRERSMRREDEADVRARAGEERAQTRFETEQQLLARDQEQLAKNDAVISGMMRNLPSRFREDPTVISLANQGDVAGIMDYVNSEINRASIADAVLSQIAQVAPQRLTPEMRQAIEASPQLFGTGFQALAPDLMKPDISRTLEEVAALSVPSDTVISGKTEGGASFTKYPPGGRKTSTTTKIPDWQNPELIVTRTSDYMNLVDGIMSRYQEISGRETTGKYGQDKKIVEKKQKDLNDLRKEYLKYRDKYMKDTEKFPAEYRAPLLSWEELVKQGGLRWDMPREEQASDSDKGKGKGKGKAAEAPGISDDAFIRMIEQKMEQGIAPTPEEADRYLNLTGGG